MTSDIVKSNCLRNGSIFALGVAFIASLLGVATRAFFSGDACGSSWPLCRGEWWPSSSDAEIWLAYSHRLLSGVLILAVVAIWFGVRRVFSPWSLGRIAAGGALLAVGLQAAVGAGLVRWGLFARDDSLSRTAVLALHGGGALILLAGLVAVLALAIRRGSGAVSSGGSVGVALGVGFAGLLVLGASSSVSSLAGTLFSDVRPFEPLTPVSHVLLRLRWAQPFIAPSVLLLLMGVVSFVSARVSSQAAKRLLALAVGCGVGQLVFGVLGLLTGSPAGLQILALALVYGAVMAYSAGAVEALAGPVVRDEPMALREGDPARACTDPNGAGVPVWKAYVALTKPRVISLLLFTTLAAMFIAAGGWPGGWLLLAVALGGYGMAGAANAINMVIDRDIDRLMPRTATRPTVTDRIPAGRAMGFALTLATTSFALLWLVANPLAAFLALAGLLFYVFVYTLLLKRRTWQNIVIGGAAGCFPPLVGYAAVAGELSALAWVLFGLIFVWTPVHFWALALLLKDDYREAGIPMLPVVRGDRATVVQIASYAVLTAVVSVLPLALPGVGGAYLVGVLLLNLALLAQSVRLVRRPERREARALFKFSMVYLALVFAILAVERSLPS